jgi:two-component system alkaline phosphatase synthesis response regulator PhoP
MLLGRKNKILVVDNDDDLFHLLKKILSDHKYNITQVKYGKECIEEAKKSSPDIIIIDVIIPKLDGIATVLKLRSIEETRSIPIIMCTSMKEAEDELLSHNLGIVDYVEKTPQMKDLMAKIERVLNQ